jgi:hypothetical protein
MGFDFNRLLPAGTVTWCVAVWLVIGVVLATWSYRREPRPDAWPLGFLAIVVLWPLAIVGYLVEVAERSHQPSND